MNDRYLATTGIWLPDCIWPMLAFSEKRKEKRSCTGSLCAHMHGSVLPVPVLCLRILPMVRDKSISFGRLWVAINISKGFGRLWVAIDLSIPCIGGDNLAVHGTRTIYSSNEY